MASTILATYDTVEQAHRVVEDLTNSGFKRADIGLALRDENNAYASHIGEEDVGGAEGASFGATVGGVLGAVVGLGAIVVPGIGPIVAAGPLAAALGALTGAAVGATTGAVTGGITASLVDVGIPEDEAHYYAESLRRGAALVSVTAHEADRERPHQH
jgi:orotidine-5'-phosphate decarboxylase